MKKLIYSAAVVSVLLLGACGDETEPTNEEPVEQTDTGGTTETPVEEPTAEEPTAEEPVEEEPAQSSQVITDDENVKATLISVKKGTDSTGKAVYQAVFEVENRLDVDIDVGHADISGDGQPFASGQSGMTATKIEPGATGQSTLSIQENEGGGFPKNVEMSLSISKYNPANPTTLEYVKDYPLSMTLPAE